MFQFGPKQNDAKSFHEVPLLKLILLNESIRLDCPKSATSAASTLFAPFIVLLDVVVEAAALLHNSIALMAS